MTQQVRQIAGLRTHLAGGPKGDGCGEGPLLVLFHGYGAPGSDLLDLARAVVPDAEFRIACPEAPIDFGTSLYTLRAWWHIDLEGLARAVAERRFDALAEHCPPGLSKAREHTATYLATLTQALGGDSANLIVGGFSQGAMLACDLMLMTQLRLRAVVLLSGMLCCQEDWRHPAASRASIPVFQSHGKADPLLPFSLAEALNRMLSELQMDTTFVPFAGGHEVTQEVLLELQGFLKTCR